MAYIQRAILGLIIIISFLVLQPTEIQSQDNFPKYCLEHPQNLIRNCQFNEGLNHWTPYVLAGGVDIGTIDGDRCHTINHPCGYMSSAGGFVAGLHQQISVTPGGIYDANLQLLIYDSFDKDDGAVGRRIGIDPTGGTDPNSPNIVWSPEVYNSLARAGHKLVWEDLKVTITAQSDTVTVFIWVNNLARVASPIHQFWIDEIGMIQIGQAEPTPIPIPPTNTPVPPTPTPVPPTETPTPLPTDTPVPTDTPLPTDTPTPTPTETPTATPLPTDTTTATPAPPTPQTVAMIGNSSASSRASGLVSSAAVEDNSALLIRYGFLCFGIGGVVMGFGIFGVLVWFYRVGSQDEAW